MRYIQDATGMTDTHNTAFLFARSGSTWTSSATLTGAQGVQEADAQRIVFALRELRVEVHAALSAPFNSSGGVPFFQGSGTS